MKTGRAGAGLALLMAAGVAGAAALAEVRPQPRPTSAEPVTEVASLTDELANITFLQATAEAAAQARRPVMRPETAATVGPEVATLADQLTGITFVQAAPETSLGARRPLRRPHPEGPTDLELVSLEDDLSGIEFTQATPAPAAGTLSYETRVTRGTQQAPTQSARPMMRGGALAQSVRAAIGVPEQQTEVQRSVSPTPEALSQALAQVTVVSSSMEEAIPSGRPQMRPAQVLAQVREEASGLLCGSPAIKGRRIAPIAGTMAGCGVQSPVKVESISGILFTPAVTLNCRTARSLETWITKGVQPAFGNYGGGVVSMYSPSHYSCRTRNGQPGAKLSEHARGNAIDITHFKLRNGTKVTLLEGWNGPRRQRRILREVHRAACGPFGTVLGPESNRFHRDHFHFDVARYTSGPYCR